MDDLNLVVIRMWAAAAWADGQIASRERQVLERLIAGAQLDDDQRATARGYLRKPVDLEDARSGALTDDERQGVYRTACKLSAVDGHIAEAERAFLSRLADVVEIDEDTAAEIQRTVGL